MSNADTTKPDRQLERMNLHLDVTKLPALDRLAAQHNRSRAGEVREAIDRHLETHGVKGDA